MGNITTGTRIGHKKTNTSLHLSLLELETAKFLESRIVVPD